MVAAGARVGTRFVATTESRGHPAYLQALVDARSGRDTVLTEAFSRGWPDAPHRVLRSAVQAAEHVEGDVVGHAGTGAERREVPRFAVSTPSRHFDGDVVQPAAEVVAELVAGLG